MITKKIYPNRLKLKEKDLRNCFAIPRELVGSELFGYVDGAFVEARRGGRPGKFELANKYLI